MQHKLGLAGQRGQDALDGKGAMEPTDAVHPGLEDLGHSAHGDAIEDLVLPEAGMFCGCRQVNSVNRVLRLPSAGPSECPIQRVAHIRAAIF